MLFKICNRATLKIMAKVGLVKTKDKVQLDIPRLSLGEKRFPYVRDEAIE